MRWGKLNDSFSGVGWKRLSAHEVDPRVSNGHEFQGVATLRDILGDDSRIFVASYFLLHDEPDNVEVIRSSAKWYDSRRAQPHRAPEWRLYYPSEAGRIQARMHAGDLMVLARTRDDQLIILLAPAESTREAEIRALFGIGEDAGPMHARRIGVGEELTYTAALVLEDLGIAEPKVEAIGDGARIQQLVSDLTNDHPDQLPQGAELSRLIQQHFADVDPVTDPDGTLMRWIEAETALFRGWEDGLIARRLERGFLLPTGTQDVEGFREFSMRIRQSRVSRAGGALQNHVAHILKANRVRFDEQAEIDGGERPDFLIPSAAAYRDSSFPSADLRLLAVKHTAKDRWRQVLNEGERVDTKHLLTLQAGISRRQLSLMQRARVQLVVPLSRIQTYEIEAAPITVLAFIRELPNAARL